jgi:hypothetical protein
MACKTKMTREVATRESNKDSGITAERPLTLECLKNLSYLKFTVFAAFLVSDWVLTVHANVFP